MDSTLVQTMLEQKLQFLDTISQASMMWWVSSVVFCATIIGAIWLKRSQWEDIPTPRLFKLLIAIFLLSVVNYGFFVAILALKVKSELHQLMAQLKIPSSMHHVFDTEFNSITMCMINGTSSFIIMLICWFVIWRYIPSRSEGKSGQADSAIPR